MGGTIMSKDLMKDVQAPIQQARPEVQKIIKRVLDLEKEKLYQERPHLSADILRIIKEEIK
jgi:hypothetical protein